VRRIFAAVNAIVSAFFVFYTVRLLVVTGFLRHTRAGGSGAYVGAAARGAGRAPTISSQNIKAPLSPYDFQTNSVAQSQNRG
jgi:hypothetical protein